jgi:hypothetical protein
VELMPQRASMLGCMAGNMTNLVPCCLALFVGADAENVDKAFYHFEDVGPGHELNGGRELGILMVLHADDSRSAGYTVSARSGGESKRSHLLGCLWVEVRLRNMRILPAWTVIMAAYLPESR